MRLFIASPVRIVNYEEIRKEFAPLIEGKWVPEENLHLTWIFLGEQSDREVDAIGERLKQIAPLTQRVKLEGLGSFGRPPKILFAGAKDKRLYKKASQFKAAGFENDRFTPHVTLCRIKKVHEKKKFLEVLHAYRHREIGLIEEPIKLYESILSDKGAKYRILD